jgi:RHS repeat-associated protein
MVNDMDIIHMNGRTYNVALGRFMQADPHIQAPSNSQSYNRYAYVLNNPMSYTDPSGYFFKAIGKFLKKNWRTIAAIAASYVTFGLATGAWTFAAASNLGAAALIGGGAAAGFVSGAISTGSLRGALQGAFSGALFGAIGGAGLGKFGAFVASGVAGGVMSDLQGGKFGHGFISAGVGAVAGGAFGKAPMARIIGSAVVGGTLSKITGGKFANGALTAAFAAALRSDWGTSKQKAVPEHLQKLFNSGNAADRQKAIDESIKHYGINMDGVKSVKYDPSLAGDGITSKSGHVTIGRAAFTRSVGWLGSTLGHEIEVHFQAQAQKGNWWTDEQGTAIQEVQAYDYELQNAARFGLNISEINAINGIYKPPYYDSLNDANKARAATGDYSSYSR